LRFVGTGKLLESVPEERTLEFNFLKGETGFRAGAAARAATDTSAGGGHRHKSLFPITYLNFIILKDSLCAGFEAAPATDTVVDTDACSELWSPDLSVSGETGN
jgi:hypothetical protein